MLLSAFIDKEIFIGKTPRGIIKGVGVSLKSYAIKYLLCASPNAPRAIFAVPVNAIEEIGENVRLSRLRPVFPKRCACIFLRLPVYSSEGAYLGSLQDLTIKNFVATTLFTDKNVIFPISAVSGCTDAILLKKEQPYPLGQRIPTPFLSVVTEKTEGVVTKPVLRAAIKKNALIKLTLSLPPFSIDSL